MERELYFKDSEDNTLSVDRVTRSGNFILNRKITSLNDFWDVINRDKSIFARHRIYPSAFFYSWHIRLIKQWIDKGWFYEAIPYESKQKTLLEIIDTEGEENILNKEDK